MIHLVLRARQRGLTLYELMIVLAITAILGMSAVGVADWIGRARAVAQVNSLIADLNLARSEAIKRRQVIRLCASRDGVGCTGGTAWDAGYIIFVDANENAAHDTDETLLRVQGQDRGLRLEYRGFHSHSAIVYQPGGIAAYNGTFTVCPRPGQHARAVVISPTGRARVGTRTAAQAAEVC